MVAIIILFLPFAHSLNSLDLIAITTCLTVWALTVEIYGASCTLDPLLAKKRQCTYSAKCGISKKLLHARGKDGQINIEQLAKEGHAEHGVDITV